MDIHEAVRPKAPSDLSKTEAALFNEVVAARPGDYFDAATIPMLAEYCRIPSELALIADAVSKFKASWLNTDEGFKRFKELVGMRDKAQKRMAMLATKMRLAQQSRYENRVKAMKPSASSGPRPWEG